LTLRGSEVCTQKLHAVTRRMSVGDYDDYDDGDDEDNYNLKI